jgi:hypothetical protein
MGSLLTIKKQTISDDKKAMLRSRQLDFGRIENGKGETKVQSLTFFVDENKSEPDSPTF